MDKEIVTPQSLMDDAGTYYTNLIGLGSWKMELIKHAQIIALTTQLSELKMEIQLLTKNASKESSKESTADKHSSSKKNYGNFEAWCLIKVNNNAEFNMAEKSEISKHLASLKGQCPGKVHKHPWRSKSKELHSI
jgi:hypothetical protein